MAIERQIISAREFFDRPGDVVASELAAQYLKHPDRASAYEGSGNGKLIFLQTGLGVHRYLVEEVILYTDNYTRTRWPNSRSIEVAQMRPGEVIGYQFHSSVLTFIKTQGAENLQFSFLRQADIQGKPVIGDENVVKPSQIAKLVGLNHRQVSNLPTFSYRGNLAFLLTAERDEIPESELLRIEAEILSQE